MRTILILLGLLFFTIKTYSQTNPQYEFYSNYDISALTGGVKNCVDEAECIEYALKLYDIIKCDSYRSSDWERFYAKQICYKNKEKIESASELEYVLVTVACMTDRQRIDLLTRLYEIEKNCYIMYTTIDGETLNFKTDRNDKHNVIDVDFGTYLVSTSKERDGKFCLKFANPVTDIDANLFSENVSSIVLPISKKLNYCNNARKDVSNLMHIEGYDVKNNLLIDSDSTLIAGAVFGMSEISLPNYVKILGEDCFRNSNLKRINSPSSVTTIKPGAFDKCIELKDIVFESEHVVDIDENAFYGESVNVLNIYVPKKMQKLYKKKYPFLKKRFMVQK